jgi:hypothetical protein
VSPLLIYYLLYLVISVGATVWVGRSLSRNGGPFLVNCFKGAEQLADSINHLLLVGFYLINIGFVAVALRYGGRPTNLEDGIVLLSSKVGVVLLVLGGMHLLNMVVFSRWNSAEKV